MSIQDLIQAFIKASALIGADAKLVAQGGTLIIDDTGAHAVNANSIMAQAATVISACTGVDTNRAAVDFKLTYNWVTLAAGIPIIAPTGFKITSITLTSGSVAVYS